MPEPQPTEPDLILKSLSDLREEAKSAHATFKKKVASGALTPEALAGELSDLFSLTADLAQYTFQAHHEHFEWAEGVDNDLDELKGAASVLLPEDALKLKTLIFDLLKNLSTAPSEEILASLNQRAVEAVAFIDEVTAEEVDEDDEADDDETEAQAN